MIHALTEKEFKELIPIELHKKTLNTYQHQIKELEQEISLLQIKLKVSNGQKEDYLSCEEISFLYSYICGTISTLIASLAQRNEQKRFNCKKEVFNFPVRYYSDWGDLYDAKIVGLENEGRTLVCDDEDEVELEKLEMNSSIELLDYLAKYYS